MGTQSTHHTSSVNSSAILENFFVYKLSDFRWVEHSSFESTTMDRSLVLLIVSCLLVISVIIELIVIGRRDYAAIVSFVRKIVLLIVVRFRYLKNPLCSEYGQKWNSAILPKILFVLYCWEFSLFFPLNSFFLLLFLSNVYVKMHSIVARSRAP